LECVNIPGGVVIHINPDRYIPWEVHEDKRTRRLKAERGPEDYSTRRSPSYCTKLGGRTLYTFIVTHVTGGCQVDAAQIIKYTRQYLDGWEHVEENVNWPEGTLGNDNTARTGMFLAGLLQVVKEMYDEYEREEDAERRSKQLSST